jgi:hypothetical protein
MQERLKLASARVFFGFLPSDMDIGILQSYTCVAAKSLRTFFMQVFEFMCFAV